MRLRLDRIVLALIAVACATGQTKRGTSAARSVADDTCLDTLRAADSVIAIVKMTVVSQDPKTRLPPDFEGLFAEEFRWRFKAPPRLQLSVVMGSEPCDSLGSRCAGGVLTVGAVAFATAHNNGKLSDIEVADVTLTPDLADSVNSALQSMSRDALSPQTGEVNTIPLKIEIVTEEEPDTVPAVRHVFQAKVPRYDAPFSYASMPAAGVDARYPFTARLAGVEDSVTLAFTVQADGTIAARSIDLLSANYRDFVFSVLDALRETRYHPAHLGDCAVATRMKQ